MGEVMAEDKIVDLWRTEWRQYKTYAEETFDRYAAKSNDLIRQLALAGIAVVWVFRETTKGGAVNLVAEIRWAAILFVMTLALDLAHYLYGTFRTSSRLDLIKKDANTALVDGNNWPHNPAGPPPELPEGGVKLLFCLKTIALIIGSGLLLHHLVFTL
jgi:hypothetical protein